MKPKRINQTMIARELGIAQRTVSKALRGEKGVSDELRQKVLDYANKTSYRGDRLMRSLIDGTSQLVGVVLPGIGDNRFLAQLFMGIETVLKRSNYKMLFTSWGKEAENDEADITALLQYKVDGLIIFPRFPPLENDPYYAKLLKAGDQVVFVNEPTSIPGCGSVYSDDEKGIQKLMDHLYDRGHRHIAYMGSVKEQDKIQKSIYFRRYAAYQEYCRTRDITPCFFEAPNHDSKFDYVTGVKNFSEAHPKITAYLCFNDYLAINTINAVRKLNIEIPEQIAVTGYGDVFEYWENHKIPLTTVSQNSCEIGERAARMCIDMISRKSKGKIVTVDPILMPRKST